MGRLVLTVRMRGQRPAGEAKRRPKVRVVRLGSKAFSIADTPLDLAVLLHLVEQVRDQLPVLHPPSVRVHRGGIPTMTPDGQHLVGPVPGADGIPGRRAVAGRHRRAARQPRARYHR